MKNENTLKNLSEQDKTLSENLYKLTRGQAEVYNWLRVQGLNTDNNTLNYWSRQYPAKRIIEVVQFAHARREAGQTIRNIGGWIHKLLKTGVAVSNDVCKSNTEFAQRFIKTKEWKDLNIYEKYVKDMVTGDDLPLTMDNKDFSRALEALYRKSQLYKSQ